MTAKALSWVLCLMLVTGSAVAGENQRRGDKKSIFDAVVGFFPKIGGALSKGRTVGQGQNDHAIPGRKEFENFDRQDPGFQSWLKRKEEERRRKAEQRQREREARKAYSNKGGSQYTIVPERAKGDNQLQQILDGFKNKDTSGTSTPGGTISAWKEEKPVSGANENKKSTEKRREGSKSGKQDWLGELLKSKGK